MIDYPALKAIEAVIDNQSFELASKSLGISQSAVSQRIQGFESYIGQKLLIRKSPYMPTKIGKAYLNLLRKVNTLENEIIKKKNQKPFVKMAINRDSLDLYFLKVLRDSKVSKKMGLQIISDDQDNTINYLKNGQVDLCISSQKKPLPNHIATKIGDMKYSLVCSNQFFKEHFSKGVNENTLSKAPLMVFDRYDQVQHIYLKDNYGVESFDIINSTPSVLSFKQAILGSFGYGLLPILDIKKEIKNKQIIQLNPKKNFSNPLYLHRWEYQLDHIKFLCQKIEAAAQF